jgi:hypothetical protein
MADLIVMRKVALEKQIGPVEGRPPAWGKEQDGSSGLHGPAELLEKTGIIRSMLNNVGAKDKIENTGLVPGLKEVHATEFGILDPVVSRSVRGAVNCTLGQVDAGDIASPLRHV